MIFETIRRRVEAHRVTQVLPTYEMVGYEAVFDGRYPKIDIPPRMPVPVKGDFYCEGRFYSPEEFAAQFTEVRFSHEIDLKTA